MGLVGHTGDASGPHLHLQLDPPTQYPQLEPWFERFAGTAFRWQDAATPRLGAGASGSTPVFAQVAGGNSASGGLIRFKRIPR